MRYLRDSLSRNITLQTSWRENTLYNLVLDKEFAEDSAGRKLFKTDTLSFVTKKKTDYGSLKIRFRKLELEKNPVVQLVNGQGSVKSFPLSAAEFNLALYNPGIPSLPPGRVGTADAPPPGDSIPAIPEPSTWAMIAMGLLVVVFRARQKR